MKLRKVYLDIESTYNGDINPDKSPADKDKFFKDYENWKFYCEKDHNGKKVIYQGIIGMLILDFELNDSSNVYKLTGKRFLQLVGKEITKERLMKELEGMNEIIGYHSRTKPSGPYGYTGYDFGVINGQLGVTLDDIPGVKSTDLELLCHTAKIYGGLKGAEEQIPGIPPRKSGILNGEEAEKLMLEAAACEDETKKKEIWKRVIQYNREDTVNLVYIEQYLRKIQMTE